MKDSQKYPPNTLLQHARKEQGWSQLQLAELIETTPVNISRWETGATFPYPYFRERLVEVFKKEPAELGLVPPSQSDQPPSQPAQKIQKIPYARNPLFTGREQLLALLHQHLSTARSAALVSPQAALYGLGGIGKSHTALEYVYRHSQEYTHVFWISAASHETLVAGFLEMAELLGLLRTYKRNQQRRIEAVKHWLSINEGWLLVLDNADNLPLVQEFLPAHHKGYLLYTTRSSAIGPLATGIAVEKLSLPEGTLLLLRQSKRLEAHAPLGQVPATERAVAEQIVQKMDGLPLALAQASAYIEETGCSLASYLQLYSTHYRDLLARKSAFSRDYSETVATTWSLSFQHIAEMNPLSIEILHLCAFLAHADIPEELIRQALAEIHPEALDPFKFDEALQTLLRYSLVRRFHFDGMPLLSIHYLVQIVLQLNMDEKTHPLWAARLVRALDAVFPEDYALSASKGHAYLPHIQACTTLVVRHRLHVPEAARLLFQAGAFLYFHGLYHESRQFHQQALAIREELAASERLALAESLNALALLSRVQDDYQQAEAFHKRALAIRQETLGPEHPTTAESLNNLGVLYRAQQNYEQAEYFLQQAFRIREKELGSGHPRTLVTFINLAKLYLEQHKYDQAEQFLQQAQTLSAEALEPDHPLIAQNLTLLARLAYAQNKYEQAETLWKQALAIIENVLGPDHPALAEMQNDLAELYFVQEDYLKAHDLYARALTISEKTLGSEHPDSLLYRERLNRSLQRETNWQG